MSARRRRNAFRSYRQAAVVLALGAGAALSLSACAPKKSPTMEPISVNETKSDYASAAAASMDEMTNLVSDLSQKAQDLPGRTAEAHRTAMHDVFDNLTRLLPILAGPEPSGDFRQQVRSVEAARDRLAPDAGDINAEPAIDTGIRAAAAAFNEIPHDDDTFAGPEIGENLKKLSSTVDELDTVGGVGRPYVAADSVQLMAQIAHQMADKIGGMSTEAPTVAVAPATTEPVAPAESKAEPAASEPAAKEPAAKEPAAKEPAAVEPAKEPAAAPIEPKPAEQKVEGEKPAAEPAPAPAPEPAPAAEPNK